MVHIFASYRNISTNKSHRDFRLDLKNTLCNPLAKSCGFKFPAVRFRCLKLEF